MAQGEGGGRPTNLTQEVVDCLKKLIERPSYIGLMNEEIYDYLSLETKSNVSKQNVSNWRKEYEEGTKNELINTFFDLMKKGMVKNKMRLLDQLDEGAMGWQSKAWILERTCANLNLKNISEVKQTNHNINANVDFDTLVASLNDYVDTEK